MFQTPNLVDLYGLWSAITGDTGAPFNSLILVIETTEERQLPTERNHLQLHKRSFRQVLNMGPLMPLLNLHYHPQLTLNNEYRMTMKLGKKTPIWPIWRHKRAQMYGRFLQDNKEIKWHHEIFATAAGAWCCVLAGHCAVKGPRQPSSPVFPVQNGRRKWRHNSSWLG